MTLDTRGLAAVVHAADQGPLVTFVHGSDDLSHGKRLLSALRTVAAIYAKSEGRLLTWPRAVHVQIRPGAWEPA